MPQGVRSKLTPTPEERILSEGTPAHGLLLTRRDAVLVPFSALWLAFAVFWIGIVIRIGAPSFFILFGAVFVAAGLFIAVGRFAADAWLRSRTSYAVSKRPILIFRTEPFPSLLRSIWTDCRT